MDKLTIPIPEGLPADQKRDLTGYLTDQVKEITGGHAVLEDDPEVRAEIGRRIKAGMADIADGRFSESPQARQRLKATLDDKQVG